MLYCPVCGREFVRLIHLKKHFRIHNFSCCPICDAKPKKLINHAYQMFANYGCEGHAILWVLLTNKTKCAMKNKELFEKAKAIALSRLSDGFRFQYCETTAPKLENEPNRKYRVWTYKEVRFLLDNYNKMTIKEIAVSLGRTESAVREKLRRLKRLNVGRRGLKPKYIRVLPFKPLFHRG